MSSRFSRAAGAALVLAAALVGLPACKKTKPTQADNPTPATGGTATPGPGASLGPTPPPSGDFPAPPPPPRYGSDPRIAAMRADAENALRQIGLALHNYHDVMNPLPGGFADKTGKPGLSWRVAILPYIEHDNLYKQFKLDEPWDSPNNKKLISQMPKIFAPPRTDTNGYTFYRGFSGPGTWLPPQTGTRPGQPIKGVTIVQITDGTSNTLLVAEAADAVIWTKPDEMEFAPNKLPQIGGVFSTGTNVLLADGSVRFLRGKVDSTLLTRLIQINDGQIVNWDN